ncbi:hypothetical protein [Leptospira borgpetersenii]|uniref:hypothetical protein n=1 Tax=Leptospira borgpetersenii TaxID=174 RepID=UPI0018812BC3|nr:hypothetical protein [Leptospira borgpetersenii]MBE8362634.1 hypothetical protein [Leptospira borgpetersenii serovar Balcanica]MBE8368378.1 hypothetical protein [Leptospira borgpetersenii serovar Balcanica]MBE8421689.1 hypothetical protein [Leptospira borgpetersenii serovar Balcanica]MBF3348759.1 hypothetical protein [Leptospira borgpetersenii serovar Balcanica]
MLRYVFSLILFFASLLFSLALSPQEIYLNSDILYLPTLVLDVLADGGNFLSWSFTPSPYFFPDFLIIFVLLLIFENAQKALICFAFLQTILFTILMERFWLFAREERKGKPLSSKEIRRVRSWILLLISLLLLIAKNFPTLYIIFLPSIHTSAFLVTLYAWPLIHKTFKKRQVWILILWITLTVASDRILLVELIVPGILAGFLFPSQAPKNQRSGWKRLFPESSKILIISGIAGLILHEVLKSFLFIERSGKIPINLSLTRAVMDGTRFFMEAQAWILSGFKGKVPIPAILISILIIALALSLVRIKKSKSTAFLFFLFAILFFAPILTGLYIDEYSLRYVSPALILAPFLLLSITEFSKRTLTPIIFFLLFILLLFIRQKTPQNIEDSFYRLFRTVPQEAQCVDEISEKTPISLVISDFWTAKRIRVFSKKRIPSIHIAYGTLEGSHTISNREWYLKNYPGTVAVFTQGLGENRIREIYGTPTENTQCGELKIYFYADFRKIGPTLRKPFQKTK